jgi:bifunctional UDP-N-acetylglucosamine pyrophosphorylase/glucosamine-1-phosphate N-acetyltransferase
MFLYMQTDIVILAAGKGKRMQSEKPKVLSLLHGKSLIQHLLEHVKESGVTTNPVIVVGVGREEVMNETGDGYRYAVQEEQLGTGHAVACAELLLKDSAQNVLVLYGDMPYISASTIANIARTHEEKNAMLTMATVSVEDYDGWRAGFYDFSRVIRDTDGTILRTVEKKDANEEELKIKEVNPAYFCFNSAWLWTHLKMLSNTNAQKEYYLTDLVGMAVKEGQKIASVSIDPKEAIGVNTKEHLELLHEL